MQVPYDVNSTVSFISAIINMELVLQCVFPLRHPNQAMGGQQSTDHSNQGQLGVLIFNMATRSCGVHPTGPNFVLQQTTLFPKVEHLVHRDEEVLAVELLQHNLSRVYQAASQCWPILPSYSVPLESTQVGFFMQGVSKDEDEDSTPGEPEDFSK